MKARLQFIAILLLLPLSAHANDAALGEEHAAMAKAHITTGKLDEAIKEYELAYRANPLPKYIYNIGELHRRLAEAGVVEEMRKSRDFFMRYLDVPGASDRKFVEARVVELRAKIESAEAAARDTSARTAEPPPASKVFVEDAPRGVEVPSEALTFPQPETSRPAPHRPRLRAWQWVLIGSAAAVVAGTAVGLGVGLSQRAGSPDATLGGMGVTWQ